MVMNVKINKLLKMVGLDCVNYNHDVSLITNDSKKCIKDSIFVAIKGEKNDGNTFILEAIKNGARTIISNKITTLGVNNILVDNPKKALGDLLFYFNKNKYKAIKKIGIIGTNGKTSTSFILNGFLNKISKSMLIGSSGCYYLNKHLMHPNTTPDITLIYDYFDIALKNKIKYIVMEISSVAIIENRVHNISFDYLIYTNFSLDHLDYHKTIDEYFRAKCIPFYSLNKKAYAIINIDDERSYALINNLSCRVLEFSILKNSKYQISNIYNIGNMTEFKLGDYVYRTNLLGKFNLYNLLPTIIIADIINANNSILFDYLYNVDTIPGRVNLYEYKNRKIIIDYAHTPIAVKKMIELGNELTDGNVIVVLGCGGNRDKEKRKIIGKILNDSRCIPIITTDNPRDEDPKKIIADILEDSFNLLSIEDRKKAIFHAFEISNENDLILILGKGDEKYTIIKGNKIIGSDYDIVKEYIDNDN